jgi:uncharacterized zinc-type alcohol dehydrogenase-like protein
MPIKALATLKAKAALEPFSYEPGPLRPHEVDVKVTHCGICHSDIHLIDNDWGVSAYPLVPGHEIVGTVAAVGAEVTNLRIGERVGIGWQCSACLECDACVHGDENYCPHRVATCVNHHGGFAEALRADARFAFKIPDSIPSETAAPLLCGGATVYSPLKRFGVRPGHRVGVVGIGGLGHLGIRFAKAFGCEVTAFSNSPDKEKEARHFGAARFVAGTDAQAMASAKNSLDFILSTPFADLNWSAYLDCLKLDGTLHFVGVPPSAMSVPVGQLMGGRRRISSSAIGSRADIADMLDFAALHGIAAQTEVVPMSEANAAIEKVRRNQARYRMVLKNP